MKYIAFSFDDGLVDFYENAFPLFEKYGFKCSINVITGFSDKSIPSEKQCIPNDVILFLNEKKFEIVNHSNSHTKNTSFDDLLVADRKLKAILPNHQFGCVLPYSQKIDLALLNQISTQFLYLADYKEEPKERPFVLRLKRKFCKNELLQYYYSNYSYVLKLDNFSLNFPKFIRLPIYAKTTNKEIEYFLKKMKNNDVVIFMFHTIKKDKKSKAIWEEGAWTEEKLEKLLMFLKTHRSFCVCTQKELIEYARK